MGDRTIEPGEIVRTARKAAGLSQMTLALELGLTSGQFISNIERGTAPVPPRYVTQLSERLGIDREQLIDSMIAWDKARLLEEIG